MLLANIISYIILIIAIISLIHVFHLYFSYVLGVRKGTIYTRESCVSEYNQLMNRLVTGENVDVILKESDKLYGIIENDTSLRSASIRERRLLESLLEDYLKNIKTIPKNSYMEKRNKILNQYHEMEHLLITQDLSKAQKKELSKKEFDIWFEIKNDYALRGATIGCRGYLQSLLND